MEYIIVLGICILAILVIKFAFGIKIKDIKKIKKIGYDSKLNDITNAFPENKIVCEEILKQFGNASVKVDASNANKEKNLSYYSVVTNNIIIADIKNTFTRIQTIAHECIHSVQNRRMLLFNFIFSNIYLLYFAIILILTIFKVINSPMVFMLTLIILGIIYYVIRSYLETDAMTKAPYVAKQYMMDSKKISKEELENVMKNYEILNKIGIPMANFQLIMSVMIKVIIYCVAIIIVTI